MPEAEALDRVGFPYEEGKIPRLFRAKGCKVCNDIGYKGRMGIHEVLVMDESLERLAVENASAEELHAAAVSNGMTTLRMDGFAKVLRGETSIEEVLREVV